MAVWFCQSFCNISFTFVLLQVAAPSQEAAPVDAAPKASRAQTALFASPADSDGDGLFSTLSLDSDAPASADLFGMVTTTGKPKANTPAGGGIGDIASYVKASQASGSGALFQ